MKQEVPSRETPVSSRETTISSRETTVPSRETTVPSRGTKVSPVWDESLSGLRQKSQIMKQLWDYC